MTLNGVFRFVFRFAFAGLGGPGGGFGGFRVSSKSSGKATTATTKKKVTAVLDGMFSFLTAELDP